MRISKSSKTDVKAAKSDFEYEVQGNYGYGWDRLTTEATMEEAKEQKKCYDENEPNVPHRIKTIAKGSVDACDDVKASKKVCASTGSKVVYDKDGIKVTETGRDYDFIATVENTTDEDYLVEGSGFEEFTVPAHDWVGLLADEDGYATLNYFKWLDVPPLTKEQVKDLWDKTALFIDWGDGTDSMCQENDYTLEEILEAMDHGGQVYVDEDPTEVNACGDIKASKSKKTSAKATTKGFDMGTSPADSIRDKLAAKGYDREELNRMGLIGLEDLAEEAGIDIRACNSSTDTDKALQHIKAAIDILGKSGKKDDITKDSIANLATVMFDIKGRK